MPGMALTPVVLSPALPSELLSYIVTQHSYPTTLVVCCPRADFLSGLADDVQGRIATETSNDTDGPGPYESAPESPGQAITATTRLLAAPLYQVAVARHIRMVFIPTVSHLRAFLSVFSPEDSKIAPPPVPHPSKADSSVSAKRPPFLVIYGFLGLHRDTSEWSAQGLSNTAAGLIETAKRLTFRAVILEPRHHEAEPEPDAELDQLLPVLSGSARRYGPDMEELGWIGRTVELRRVLGRWFRFEDGEWDDNDKLRKDHTARRELDIGGNS